MTQIDQDAEHLKLLSIFHYVVAGLNALMASIPLIHLVMGLVFIGVGLTKGGEAAPMALVGMIFAVLAGGMVLLGWGLAVCIFLAGRYLAQRRHYMFCLVVAAICSMVFPYGMALGICTIIVLCRPSVKALFEASGDAAG